MRWIIDQHRPAKCPTCGTTHALVVNQRLMCESDRELVAEGRVVVIDTPMRGLPTEVCLACYPEWSQVNRIARKLFEWQIAKEAAVANQDFQLATSYLDRQASLRGRLADLVSKWISGASG